MDKAITETIGVDLGDRRSSYCVLEQHAGQVREEGQVESTPQGMAQFFRRWPGARVVLEAGGHSPWASRLAAQHCTEALVANPRALKFIFANQRKSDPVDARALAKVGRLDTSLLSPVVHRGLRAQQDLVTVRLRRSLVEARTKLVNALRGTIKSLGYRLPKHAAKCVGLRRLEEVPEELRTVVRPLLGAIDELSERIGAYDKRIERLATKSYPVTAQLQQVGGVGVLTALAYVLTMETPGRLRTSRDAGAYFGLVPRRDQSGATDKQLGITKAGDRLVRTLLVQGAHRILGPFGEDSALRRQGLHLAGRGGKAAKKRAVIAVARKLAVLLHRLWVTGEVYEPLRAARTA
jgi:transposase